MDQNGLAQDMPAMDREKKYDEQWELFRAGHAQALGAIYDQYILLLYRYGHKLTSDRSIVEDSIQDVFAELWKRRDRISPTTSVKFYLFRSLRRKIFRQLKHQLPAVALEDEIRVSHEAMNATSSLTEEQVYALQQAITHLSPRQKEAIYLKFYNRLSNDEIAEVMEIDKRTVYNLVSQALGQLKQELKPTVNVLQLIGWLTLLYHLI